MGGGPCSQRRHVLGPLSVPTTWGGWLLMSSTGLREKGDVVDILGDLRNEFQRARHVAKQLDFTKTGRVEH
jgi:hypothetical protein